MKWDVSGNLCRGSFQSRNKRYDKIKKELKTFMEDVSRFLTCPWKVSKLLCLKRKCDNQEKTTFPLTSFWEVLKIWHTNKVKSTPMTWICGKSIFPEEGSTKEAAELALTSFWSWHVDPLNPLLRCCPQKCFAVSSRGTCSSNYLVNKYSACRRYYWANIHRWK